MQLSALSDNNLDVIQYCHSELQNKPSFWITKKFLLETKSDGSEGHIVNGGFNELEAGANYRPGHRGIFTPNFPLI